MPAPPQARIAEQTIPCYGGEPPAMFAIERRAMGRAGHVIAFLDRTLPAGRILD